MNRRDFLKSLPLLAALFHPELVEGPFVVKLPEVKQPRAMGGPIKPGQACIVGNGERELFIPNSKGRIVSNVVALQSITTTGSSGGYDIMAFGANGQIAVYSDKGVTWELLNPPPRGTQLRAESHEA